MSRRLPVQVGPWVSSPGSSTEEHMSYKQEVRGSTPGSHPKGARRRRRVGPARKAGALLRGFESLGTHAVPAAHPRSSVDRAPGSEPDGREFESRRGHSARPHVRVVRSRSAKPVTPVRVRLRPQHAIHCGHPQAGVGRPAAPHKGGAPGSTPGLRRTVRCTPCAAGCAPRPTKQPSGAKPFGYFFG
jgi:hypothetical protein